MWYHLDNGMAHPRGKSRPTFAGFPLRQSMADPQVTVATIPPFHMTDKL